VRTMKYAVLLLGFSLLAAPAQARGLFWQTSFEAGLPSAPQDFRLSYQAAAGAGLGIGIEATPHIEAMLEFAYHSFPIHRSYFFGMAGLPDDGTVTLKGGVTTALMALFNMRLRPLNSRSRVQPSLCVGTGLCRFSVHETRAASAGWTLDVPAWGETDLAARALAGVDVRWTEGVRLYAEGGEALIATTGDMTRVGLLRWGVRFTPEVFGTARGREAAGNLNGGAR